MKQNIRPAETETYEHTISGLLAKRRDMLTEAERIRDRLAEIKNDLSALDRTLGTLGFTGDLEAMMPRQKREVIFGRGELLRAISPAMHLVHQSYRSARCLHQRYASILCSTKPVASPAANFHYIRPQYRVLALNTEMVCACIGRIHL